VKVIIAGSRSVQDYNEVLDAIAASNYEITEVVSGGAGGVDSLGEEYAIENGLKLAYFKVHSYDWKQQGKRAGHLRNQRMVRYADALIAVWDGRSPGTRNCIQQARAQGILVYVHRVA
jgi:hypothetical protein